VTTFLDMSALMHIASNVLGPRGVVIRDAGLLASALARPMASYADEDAYPSLIDKAAALLHSLVCNHGLIDGNKRLGWAATVVFCDINGLRLDLSDDAVLDLVIGVAEGKYDLDEIVWRLSK